MKLSFEKAVKAVCEEIVKRGIEMNTAQEGDIYMPVGSEDGFAVRVKLRSEAGKPTVMDFGEYNTGQPFKVITTFTEKDGVMMPNKVSRSQAGQVVRQTGRNLGLANL